MLFYQKLLFLINNYELKIFDKIKKQLKIIDIFYKILIFISKNNIK